ncbi:hypothetical protein [Bacillus sp. EB01]|uniref:hypothetical protein n=1 Tax=Bacillus sp. EB01 TaxID=1347086 RepID=UPI0012DBE8C8|nr:hypothetical protein [Bacillus sp. EB01]
MLIGRGVCIRFLKLNAISLIYAIMMLIPAEFILNTYRIQRITGWSFKTLDIISLVSIGTVAIVGTGLVYFLTKKWFSDSYIRFWTMLLWLPYHILLIYLTSNLLPFSYEGDNPSPATGLLMLGALFFYPFYILLVNMCIFPSDEQVRT